MQRIRMNEHSDEEKDFSQITNEETDIWKLTLHRASTPHPRLSSPFHTTQMLWKTYFQQIKMLAPFI